MQAKKRRWLERSPEAGTIRGRQERRKANRRPDKEGANISVRTDLRGWSAAFSLHNSLTVFISLLQFV